MNLGTTFCFVEADAPRVSCVDHGVIVAAVPWARHRARFTRPFDDQVAWLRGAYVKDGEICGALGIRVTDGSQLDDTLDTAAAHPDRR